jgi:hypothetical protein
MGVISYATLQYSNTPILQLPNGLVEQWSDGKSQRKIGLTFPLAEIMEDEKK